jgi:serine phosphatase RsbU (regulator of sigma subunit)
MNFIKPISLTFFLVYSYFLLAQDLNTNGRLEKLDEDTAKVSVLLDLSKESLFTDATLALKYGTEAKNISIALNYPNGEGLALKAMGLANYYQGNYVEVILNWEQGLAIFEKLDNKLLIANLLSNLGAVYNNQGDDVKALELYFKALTLADANNDVGRKITTLNNIGLVYSKKQGSENIALDYLFQSLKLSETKQDFFGIGTASINIGEVYYNLDKIEEALIYLNTALEAFRKENSPHESDALTLIGKTFLKQKEFTKAIDYQEQSYQIAKKLGGQLEMAKALIAMAETYDNWGNPNRAIKYYNEAIQISKKLGVKYEKLSSMEGIAHSYTELNDYKTAYNYLQQAMILKDTLFSEKNQGQLNVMKVKYDMQNMTKENEILKKDIEIRVERNKTQRAVIFFMLLGFVVTTIQILLLFRANKQKRKANDALNEKNILISSQQKEILDSIVYAKRIQFSALPHIEDMGKHVSDIFVLFKPKDVVSGDFYWFAEVENQLVITVADCTGHGVPGAFMSMLGMSMLELIVTKEYITQPDIILKKMRKAVVKALGQTGSANEQKDGMDMSLCSINLESLEMQWSGANNPCLLIQDGELRDLKPDKMPIAIYIKMDKYTLHTIQLKKGDIIYLISDGFHDQFGGPENRKFMSKNLKNLLVEISSRPMKDQQEILDLTITEWMKGHGKEYHQTDDITIMGIKI